MGDRVSISFVNGTEESVALFNHWGGKEFPKLAEKYVRELKKDINAGKVKELYPLGRLEPNTVMVDFVRWLTKQGIWKANEYNETGRCESSYYFGATANDGDNSDNGHFCILLVFEEESD